MQKTTFAKIEQYGTLLIVLLIVIYTALNLFVFSHSSYAVKHHTKKLEKKYGTHFKILNHTDFEYHPATLIGGATSMEAVLLDENGVRTRIEIDRGLLGITYIAVCNYEQDAAGAKLGRKLTEMYREATGLDLTVKAGISDFNALGTSFNSDRKMLISCHDSTDTLFEKIKTEKTVSVSLGIYLNTQEEDVNKIAKTAYQIYKKRLFESKNNPSYEFYVMDIANYKKAFIAPKDTSGKTISDADYIPAWELARYEFSVGGLGYLSISDEDKFIEQIEKEIIEGKNTKK